jgi:glucose-1-phosphate thymidylyltransferase
VYLNSKPFIPIGWRQDFEANVRRSFVKGIILAGGTGSRLWPATLGVSKQMLLVYDKPMIYYPLSTLISAKVSEILVITTPHDAGAFKKLLGDGAQFGVSFTYAIQETPTGLADAFRIGKNFIDGQSCSLILGDNIFYGVGLGSQLQRHTSVSGAQIFAYPVKNPNKYGVVEFGPAGDVVSLEEKPVKPKSSSAVTGLYFYDSDVVELAETLRPSPRGELEITDLNRLYLDMGKLSVEMLPRGSAWLDTGTFEDMLDASNFIKIIEDRQGFKIGCPEELAWRNGWLTDEELLLRAQQLEKSSYGTYLKSLVGQN